MKEIDGVFSLWTKCFGGKSNRVKLKTGHLWVTERRKGHHSKTFRRRDAL
jgi:hypothetical protein